MSSKTRPIGTGVRNVTVTLPIAEVLGVEQQARASGVGRSPYIRTLVEWALEHGVLVRPEAVSYRAYLAALRDSVSPLPSIQYEVILTKLGPPLQVVLNVSEKHRPPYQNIVYLDHFDPLKVAENAPPSHKAPPRRAGAK